MTDVLLQTAQTQLTTLRICRDCVYHRLRARPELFSTAEMQSAGGLKALTEWEQQEKQHAERERERFAGGAAFTYEPHNYAWCAKFTKVELVEAADQGDAAAREELMRTGGAVMDAVTGDLRPIYVLCQRMNPEGACREYVPKPGLNRNA